MRRGENHGALFICRYGVKGVPRGKNETEKIPVYIKIIKGRTICLCHAGRRRCGDACERDFVTRDKFEGWEETAARDRYGR